MCRLIAICIIIVGAFGCSDDGKAKDEPCEGEGCYLLGCQWEISDGHCDANMNGEFAVWTETSFGCDNPDHDGVTQPGHVDCYEWETCTEADGVAECM